MAEEDVASQLTYDEEEFEGGEYEEGEGEYENGQLVLREDWEQVQEDDGSSYWFNSR